MLEGLRGAALLVPDAASCAVPDVAWQRYGQIDQASYDFVDDVTLPITSALVERAATQLDRKLHVRSTRLLRLRAGDYALAHHDRFHEDNPVELTLDLSPASVPGAEVHYRRRGAVFFRMPCVPRTLAIVERGPTVSCNHTYISKLMPDAIVVRYVVLAA
jgi:hypothetical protein